MKTKSYSFKVKEKLVDNPTFEQGRLKKLVEVESKLEFALSAFSSLMSMID